MSLTPLVLGFVPLLDCAPLVVATTHGFAAAEGLDLTLVRENSWANIRDRVIVGHFDAAHMLGPMPIASSLGIGHLKVPMIAPLALGLGGNAITVSTALWDAMLAAGASPAATPDIQGAALRRVVKDRREHGLPRLTLATVYPFSSHHYLLRYWLAACGVDPDEDVTLVVIPPPFMADALRAVQIDGFCVGEPWNSVAVERGIGTIVTHTTAIWRRSPEKVLGMRAAWAQQHPTQTAALVRALCHAAAWCEQPASHRELAELLARPEYVNESAEVLHRGISARLPLTPSAVPHHLPGFLHYAAHAANVPEPAHAEWYYTQMVRWRQTTASDAARTAARATCRPDLYHASLTPLSASPDDDNHGHDGATAAGTANASTSGFFDDASFNINATEK